MTRYEFKDWTAGARALCGGIGLLTVLAVSLALVMAQMPPAGRAPFEAARWESETLEARLDSTWYVIDSLNSVPTTELVAFAKTVFPSTWRDRIPWDIAHLLDIHGSPLQGDVVALSFVDPADASLRVSMSAELIIDYYEKSDWAKKRGAWGQNMLFEYPDISPVQITEDLGYLLERIRDQFSYRTLTGYDYKAAFTKMIDSLDGDMRHWEFARRLRSLMAPFGDGHSRVNAPLNYTLPSGSIPCLFHFGDEGRVVGIRPDHSEFLASDYPYVLSIDGYPIDKCIATVQQLVTSGSPQFEHMQARRLLQYITWWRGRLGAPNSNQVRLTLGHIRNGNTHNITMELVKSAPSAVMWPRATSNVMNNNIGYLRLESMEQGDGYRAWLLDRMHAFRNTEGIIIDVRGNGGGSRDALQMIAPFLLSPKSSALVANIACYRLADAIEGDGIEVLSNRSLFLTNDSRWNKDERRAIKYTMDSFKPDWDLPREEFSKWHVMVVSRRAVDGVYHYSAPVVVLLDDRCFSATDIFLGALQGLENVTLMGTASSGGSGRAQRLRLPHSGLSVRLSSIASFRRSGARYDGLGVAPDVVIEPRPKYWLVGGCDNVLDAAIRRILGDP